MRTRTKQRVVSVLVVGGAIAAALPSSSYADLAACPVTSNPTSWSSTFLDTNTTKSGTVFSGSGGGRLELQRNGEQFGTTQMTATSNTVYAAVGDFNNDGWPDFVGAPENTTTGLNVYQNYTWQNEGCTTSACTVQVGAPDWTNPATVVTPKFTQVRTLGSGMSGLFSLAAADFNGDGWDDVFMAYAPNTVSGINDPITTLTVYLNQASNDVSGYARFLSGYAAQSGFTITSVLGDQTWSGTNIQAVDYNKDGRKDILIGTDKSNGSIRILLNSCTGTMQASGVIRCTSNPVFTDGGFLKSGFDVGTSGGFGSGAGGLPVFAYADLDADNLPDLVVGAANCCTTAAHRLRIYKGCSGGTTCTAGLENSSSQSVTFDGAATAIFVADFSLDGKPDLAVATDGKNYNTSVNGGTTFYYRNNGTSAPFADGLTAQLTQKGTTSGRVDDYDVGFVFDYDRDPTRSPDMMVANGNDTNGYYVIADRVSPKYVDCGDAASGVMDLGNLVDLEMVITSARITPVVTLNGGTVTYWLSNEEPANWVQANLCTGSATDYCVSFPKAVGRSVRWKAVMCSNATHTTTPNLVTMAARFDYTRATEHYRAGVVVNDGVAYVGAFHQPGDRGRFYATSADLKTNCTGSTSPVCWDASAKLDASSDASRMIYTALANLPTRLDFDTANASNPLLQSLLSTADTSSTTSLITWVRSKRFGLGNQATPLTKLGSVETSTPAVLGKPGRPSWYSFVTALERSRIEAFITQKAARKPLVLFGAKDGMIHAIHTRPTDMTNTKNGTEAWAYIPPTVARGMLADYTATMTANAAAADGLNHPTIASYPDGSPTLVDYHAGNGVYKTVALVAEGNGGKSVTVLDVTETVDPTSEAINGPTPMWSATPGDGDAGQAYAKPAIARVLINNAERYVVIAATGSDSLDVLGLKGRVVAGYDLANGSLLWKFQSKCPVTSDLTVFETDDTAEPDAPTLNGFADRVVFADKCGYVYKLAPGVDLAGGWYKNTGMGTIVANTTPDGKPQYALFSTSTTSGALGTDRPITGTIAARTDSSTRMVLFFGTGGLESVAQNLPNAFYAVYVDTGAIRSKITGTCTLAGVCEKFYGGTVVTPDQVILTRTTDPSIASTTCDPGSSKVQALKLEKDSLGNFTTDFTLSVSSAVMGSLYGDAGAIYFATFAGDVARIGTPRAAVAGADSANNVSQGTGVGDQGTSGQTIGTTSPFMMMGWRMVL